MSLAAKFFKVLKLKSHKRPCPGPGGIGVEGGSQQRGRRRSTEGSSKEQTQSPRNRRGPQRKKQPLCSIRTWAVRHSPLFTQRLVSGITTS